MDRRDQVTSTGRSALEFAKMALGVTPIIAAAYYGIGKVKANEAVNNPLAVLFGSNAQHELGVAIGGTAKRLTSATKKEQEQAFKRGQHDIRTQLEKTGAIRELFKSVDDKNAMLQALAVTLDDPMMGLNDTQRTTMKRALLEAAGTHTPDHERVVTEILRAIHDSGSEDVSRNYIKSLSSFGKVSNQLGVPTGAIPTRGVTYNPVTSPLGKVDTDYVADIQRMVGSGHRVEVQEYSEIGTNYRVAKIYGTKGTRDTLLATMPLHAINSAGKEVPPSFFRTGESGRTLMSVPTHMIDAHASWDIASRIGTQDVRAFTHAIDQGATIDGPAWAMRRLKEFTSAPGHREWSNFRAGQASIMTDIKRVASTGSAFGAHMRFQDAATRTVGFYNFDRLNAKQQQQAMAWVGSSMPGRIQAGLSNASMLHRSEFGTAGALGVHAGSYYEAAQNTFQFNMPTATGVRKAIDRDMIPLSMREFQVTGRPSAFVGHSYRVNGTVYGSLLTEATRLVGDHAGSDIAAYDRALQSVYDQMTPYGTTVSGGHVAPTVIDLRGRMQRDTGGEGLSYMGGKQKIMNSHQFAVLDPTSHGYLQSKVIERLRAEGDKGLVLTRDELREIQYLGETSNGSKFLPFNEDMQGMRMRLAEVTNDRVAGGDRRTISIIADEMADVSILKSFSPLHKGTNIVRDGVLGVLDKKAEAFARGMLVDKMGFQEADIHVVNSDMLKKGAFGMLEQIRGSALMTGKVSHEALKQRAGEIAMNMGEQVFKTPMSKKPVQINYQALAHYAQAAMELLHKAGAGPEELAGVLSAVYWGAEGKSANYGLDRQSILQLGKNLWGNDKKKLKLFGQAISAGAAFAAPVQQLGPGPRDWGQARGSIEPRFVKTLNERFLGMGMSSSKSSEIVSGIVKNKIGLVEHYSLATQLLKMQTTLHGGGTPLNAFGGKQPTRIGFNELFGKILSGSEKSETALFDFLKTQEHGAVFHMDDIKGEHPGLHRIFKEVTGQGEVYFPGREGIEASRGALIKQTGGSVAVEGRLAEVINSFQSRMLSIKNAPRNSDDALQSLTQWKGMSTKLFAEVFDQLHSGKIKGATSPYASRYFLNEGTNFSNRGGGAGGAMHKRALENLARANGNGALPVHLEAAGFLSQLSDMPIEGTAKATTIDLSKKAERFFTGMEKGGLRQGIISIGARHPEVGPANVFLTQIFRHLEEVESLGGQDSTFQMIRNSEIGKQLLDKHFYTVARDPLTGKEIAPRVPMNIQSFAEMNMVESEGGRHTVTRQMRRGFFKEFVENIREFTGGKDAGVAHYPKLDTNVGNFGVGAGSWLDVDGDRTNVFLLNRKHSTQLVEHLKAKNADGVTNGAAYAQGDAELKFFHNRMQKETRQAITNMVDKSLENGAPSTQRAIEIGIGNETNVSMNTGPLDVNLKGMHDALGNNVGIGEAQITGRRAAFGRDVLAHIEENFNIKSKHIPTEISFAEDISKAARIAMDTGNMDEFGSVLKRVFAGTDFGGKGIHVQGQVAANGKGPEADALTAMLRTSMPNEGRYDFHYSLDDFLGDMGRSARRAVGDGSAKYGSKGRLEQGLMGENPVALEVLNTLRGGQTLQGGAIEGFMGRSQGARTELAVDAMREGAMKIGNHMMAPMALGVLGAVTVAGMMGGGLAPEPIIMPGEIPSGSMSAGSLFNRRDPQVDPGSLGQQGSQYDTMPGMVGETYAVRPNSYQIRGEVSSGSGLATFGSYFNQLSGGSGRGQITINDQRRPITRNYVDRLMGE